MPQVFLPELRVTRVRHALRFRLLQVARVESITPCLLRVVLTGDDLADFVSLGFDDHCKLIFPSPGQERPVLPELGANGPVFADGVPKPIMRDYTPRHFDPAARELAIDFVLHDEGVATRWALQARPGQWLGVGGPRGSFIIPDGFDWHLLIGDETALPAISRRLEELPTGKAVTAIIAVRNQQAQLEFKTRADLHLTWCPAASGELVQALGKIEQPSGQGHVWAAGESAEIRAVRQYLVDQWGIDKSRIRASSYWKHGAVAVHETLDD